MLRTVTRRAISLTARRLATAKVQDLPPQMAIAQGEGFCLFLDECFCTSGLFLLRFASRL